LTPITIAPIPKAIKTAADTNPPIWKSLRISSSLTSPSLGVVRRGRLLIR
jgi:hypothetical protein